MKDLISPGNDLKIYTGIRHEFDCIKKDCYAFLLFFSGYNPGKIQWKRASEAWRCLQPRAMECNHARGLSSDIPYRIQNFSVYVNILKV